MKRFFSFLKLSILVFVASLMMTSTVWAEIELDYSRSSSGEGWSYDAGSKTLTLDGYYQSMPEDTWKEIYFKDYPKGFTIHLADGSENFAAVISTYPADDDEPLRITGNGTLNVRGWMESGFQIDSGTVICAKLAGKKLIINGGTVKSGGTKAISNFIINGGDVYLEELDAYSLKITGGNVRAESISNTNGTGLEGSSYIMTGGSLSIDVTENTHWNGFSFIDYDDDYDDPGKDLTEDILKMLERFGTMTDENGRPVHFKVECPYSGKYHVTFVDENGEEAKHIRILPKANSVNTFIDLQADAFYYPAVMWAVEKGITNGITPTTFEPLTDCTRGQIVTFLYRGEGMPAANGNNVFGDVKETDFYFAPVIWAVEKGITTGTSVGVFSPGEKCTRAQAVTFLWRLAGEPKASNTNNPFTDVVPGYYYDAVLWAVENGITTGMTSAAFAPDEVCTRSQIVTFLHRYYQGK